MKAAPRFRDRHPAVTVIAVSAVVAVTVFVTFLELTAHFADTRNWGGVAATMGGFVVFMAALWTWSRVEDRRVDRADRARRRQQGWY